MEGSSWYNHQGESQCKISGSRLGLEVGYSAGGMKSGGRRRVLGGCTGICPGQSLEVGGSTDRADQMRLGHWMWDRGWI